MLELIFTLGVVVLAVVVWQLHQRVRGLERDVRALREGGIAAAPMAAMEGSPIPLGEDRQKVAGDQPTILETVSEGPSASLESQGDERERAKREAMAKAAAMLDAEAAAAQDAGTGPWQRGASAEPLAPQTAEPVSVRPERPDFETALGTRWAVWVGGLALALGGVFLIRYTIEAGIFGPAVRLTLAGLMGVALAGAGEFLRRTGFRLPVEGMAGAYIPAILTAVGVFMLFGTVYAAHAVYDYIGPALAFGLLGAIAVATIAAALVHGQALGALGLLGAFATPALVASEAPNVWALFVYLAIVLAASAVIARMRDWRFLMTAALVGTGLWTVLYAVSAAGDQATYSFTAVLFIGAVMLACLALLWLSAERDSASGVDGPSIATAILLGMTAFVLFANVWLEAEGGAWRGAIIVSALAAAAAYRQRALPLLHAAGVVVALVWLRTALSGSFDINYLGEQVTLDGASLPVRLDLLVNVGAVLGVLFLAGGLWRAHSFVENTVRSVQWAAWAAAVPLVIVGSLWFVLGNLDRDLIYGLLAALLVLVLVGGAEWIARAEQPPLRGGEAVSALLIGAAFALFLCLHMLFGPGLTTVLTGAAAAMPALATRVRRYPILGWLAVGSVVATIARIGLDPTIVGAELLSRTFVFNWLLPGYGVPALAFGFAAWQLKRTTDGRPRLAMEAGAALFALLTVAMLVRHAMNGGVIDSGAPTLAEQSIYTLIALGAGGILIALDMRSPSPVFRYGSMAVGVLSMVFAALLHFLALNPLFTDESTGRIAVFNLLFLGYLLPALAAGLLAWYARGKRPAWYSAALALLGAIMALAYATLSVRRIFQGEFIALWRGMSQAETYTYSALWLVLGVAILTTGMVMKSQILRLASAALIVAAVAKVFLFDMSELEGVLRALSFIGLGLVLIGIGLFYQRMLVRTRPS